MPQKVTNADLADKLDALATRLVVIETEARVAKWVLRAIAGLIIALLGKTLAKHFGIDI